MRSIVSFLRPRYMSRSILYEQLLDDIDLLMQQFSHTKKDIGYGWRWTFTNSLWFDLIDYQKQGIVILRVGRGAWLVREHPILLEWFDDVSKVIAKLTIHDRETIQDKHLLGVLELLDKAPRGIGAFD